MMKSPVRSVHSIHAIAVTEKLREVNADFLETVQSKKQAQLDDLSERSQLELTVNDSQSGKSFDECYEKGEVLGEGGFALVHRCKHKGNGSYYAVKEIDNEAYEDEGTNSLKDEIAVMKQLRENVFVIVRLHDVFFEAAPDRTYLVMEEMRGGDLLDRINDKQGYSERKGKVVARTLLEAISFCHKKRVVHRDIKPENILLVDKEDDTNIKICDFGCARYVTGPNSLKTLAGSPEYAAPEVYEHSDTGGYDEKCDLWSAGVVIYVLLSGTCLFEGTVVEMAQQICAGDWTFVEKYWKEVSQDCKDLIERLLTVDPRNRCTAQEALGDKWLKRPKVTRSNSFKFEKKKKKAMRNILDNFYQSARDWDVDLDDSFVMSPVPMEWIPESPTIRKLKREQPGSFRRLAKPKLGDKLAKLPIPEDSISNLSLNGLPFDEPSNSSDGVKSHESFKFHCSIPNLDDD